MDSRSRLSIEISLRTLGETKDFYLLSLISNALHYTCYEKARISEREFAKNFEVRLITSQANLILTHHGSRKFQKWGRNKNLRLKQSYPYTTTVQELKQKLQEKDIIVIKADKGNCVVLLDRSEYTTKILEFLENRKCAVASVNSDFDYQTHVQEVRAAVLSNTRLIKNPKSYSAP